MNAAGKFHLLAIGAIHIDDTASPVGPLVPRASNPVRWTRSIGGVTANALRAARRESATLDLSFIAAVGDDAVAGMLRDALVSHGINTEFVTLDDTATGRYSVILDQDGELYVGLADVDNAEKVSLKHIVERPAAKAPDAVLIDTNLNSDTITALSSHNQTRWHCPLIALAVSPAKAIKLLPIRDQLSLLICNRREAVALIQCSGAPLAEIQKKSSESLANGLLDMGFSNLVLTDGAEPVVISGGNRLDQIQVPPLSIQSTVNGAGDALAGAVIARWVMGETLRDAVRVAGLPAASRILDGEIPPQTL